MDEEGTKMNRGIFKLTNDFEIIPYSGAFVRDINLTPTDTRLPDVAVCRVFSNRDDAERILNALQKGEVKCGS